MIIALFFITLLALAAYGAGKSVLCRLKIFPTSPWEDYVFSSGLGLGAIALGILLLGLSKLLYPPVLVSLAVILIVISAPHLLTLAKKLPTLRPTRWDLFFLLALLLITGLEFSLINWSPLDFDELNYHLALPEIFFRSHAVAAIPYNIFSNFPLNVEMLYLPALAWEGAHACRAVHLFFLLLCTITVFSMARRYFNPRAALFSALIFMGIPNVIRHSVLAYNDFGLLLYILLSIHALLAWESSQDDHWLVLSGVFCGLAVGAKYTGAINLLLLSLFIFARTKKMKPLIVFLLPGFLLVSPWLLKNVFFVGNPVYPFLYSIFGGKYWSAFNMQRYLSIMNAYGTRDLASLPRHMTLAWEMDFPLGPALFIFLPFLLFLKRVDHRIKLLLSYAVLYFLFWVNTSPVNRFFLPAAALLCVISGYTLAGYREKSKVLYGIFVALLLATLSYYLFVIGTGVVRGSAPVKATLNEYFQTASYINQDLPRQAKLLFIGEPRAYGFNKNIVTSSMFDTAPISVLVKTSANAGEVAARLRQQGYTHLLLNQNRMVWLSSYFNYFNWESDAQKALFQRFLESGYLREVKRIGPFRVLEIR